MEFLVVNSFTKGAVVIDLQTLSVTKQSKVFSLRIIFNYKNNFRL